MGAPMYVCILHDIHTYMYIRMFNTYVLICINACLIHVYMVQVQL